MLGLVWRGTAPGHRVAWQDQPSPRDLIVVESGAWVGVARDFSRTPGCMARPTSLSANFRACSSDLICASAACNAATRLSASERAWSTTSRRQLRIAHRPRLQTSSMATSGQLEFFRVRPERSVVARSCDHEEKPLRVRDRGVTFT